MRIRRPGGAHRRSATPRRRLRRRLGASSCSSPSSSGCSARPRRHARIVRATSCPTRTRSRRSSRRTSPPRRRRSPSSTRSRPACRPRSADDRPAQGHQRRPRRGQGQDHAACRPRSTWSRRPTTSSSPSSPTSTRSSSRSGEEAAKQAELAERKALLADRIRSAYDTDRTSLLETFLSGGTFTDVLAEISYYLDVGEQDKALAEQIATTRRSSPRSTRRPIDTRDADRRAAPARRPPRSSPSTRACAPQGRQGPAQEAREAGRPRRSRQQKAAYARIAANKAAAAAGRRQGRRRPRSGSRTRSTSSSASRAGRQHPVASTTARCPGRWPATSPRTSAAPGSVWEPPQRLCAHFHNGIDMVAPVRHAGPARPAPGRSSTSAGTTPTARPGLDRDHRPREAWDLVRPHAAALPGRSAPAARRRRARSSATRATPATRPARTSTGRSSSTASS